jgi:hypothetical protein
VLEWDLPGVVVVVDNVGEGTGSTGTTMAGVSAKRNIS